MLLKRRNTFALGAVGLGALWGCGDAESGDGDGGSGGSTGSGGPSGPGATGTTGTGSGSTSGTSSGDGGAGGGGPSNVTVGSYADLNLEAHAIYSIDMALQDYPQWSAHPDSGEVRVHETGIWWDGGDALRSHPPTVEQRGSGIGSITNLWRDATFAIRKLNFRFEWQAGPEYCSRTNGNLPKFVIALTAPELSVDAKGGARPMLYWRELDSADNQKFNRPDTLAICPAQGTVQLWAESEYSEETTFWPMQAQPLYFADSAGTFQGAPIIDPSEIVTIEMRMIAISTRAHPRGLIAVRVYRRNGEFIERGCPWDLDAPEVVDLSYLHEIQMFGGGYYNNANPHHENNFTRVGGHITLAANYDGWLGPRAGFVI